MVRLKIEDIRQNCRKRHGKKRERKRKVPGKRFIFCIAAVFMLLFSLASPVWAGGDYEEGSSGKTITQGNSLTVGDPISAANGAYSFSLPLISLGGPMDLDFSFLYSRNIYNWWAEESFPKRTGPIGKDGNLFWWSPRVRGAFWGDVNDVRLENGDVVSFEPDGQGGWVLNEGHYLDNGQPIRYVMKNTTNYFYMMDPIRERVYIFSKNGHILYVLDRNSNNLSYTYNGPDDRISKIEDGLGRELNFTYKTVGSDTVIHNVTDQTGRGIVFNYDASAADNGNEETLRSITDAMGNTHTFHYQAVNGYLDNIARVEYPKGNHHYENHFIEHWVGWYYGIRVDNQTDAYGNTTNLTYNGSAYKDLVTYPDASQEAYEHNSSHSPPKSLTDVAGKAMNFTKNEHNQLTSVTDRFGDITNLSYHADTGKLAAITNAKGDILSYTYTAQKQTFTNPENGEQFNFTFHNLACIDYPDGTMEEFTYDAKGNMLTHTDRVGKAWSYEYNGRGQVTKAINPLGGETIYTYNSDGTVTSSRDSDMGLTNFGYDAYKRITRITYPDGAFAQITYDLNDHITSVTDQNGRIYMYEFDQNGNFVQELDPDGHVTSYEYDLMDRLTKLTNRLGGATNFSYDSRDRTVAITDSNGDSIHFDYNPQSRFVNITDEAGKVWRKNYDEEWLLSSIITPLGRTTTFKRDKQGRITRMIDSLGRSTNFTRDQMGLMTAVTDPLGRKTAFVYNGNDFLQCITKPVIGTVTYTRNDMGLYTEISDTRDKKWHFTYTPMGRTSSHTDPLGNTWQYEYDDLGQFNRTLFPTGGTLEKSYDHGGNLLRENWSDGTDIQYIYDNSYRLVATNGLNFSHNDGGMVTNTNNSGISFPATYDKEKKLTAVTYNNGAFNVTYEYDSRDLLTKVKDDLTNTEIIFDYDDDGRFIGVNRSNGVSTETTRDDASRITRIKDGAFSDQQYTLDAAGQITQAVLDVPSDPADALTSRTDYFTYDDASQVNSSGYSYDARGRQTASPTNSFTWDGAGRLKAIGQTTLEYNGLGGLMTRTEGGHKTSYYYNYAIGLLPIVAEKNETTSQWKRFYVWTPGGSLLYFIDAQKGNEVYFYHFDHQGNTLFLTDSSGAVTDSYAYSPYGLLRAHNGTSDQPFTFVGQFGVRAEGESGLYQMGMRYYDPVTAKFLSRDPAWPVTDDPFSLNPYQYANQNPLMYIDPTGQGVGLSTGSFVTLERKQEKCPIPCKGVCKKIEVNKVMLVMGDDKGWIAGHYIRHSYRWARDYLRKKCGKGNVIAMRKPSWKTLKGTLNANKNDLAAFVFIGHGESHAAIVINDDDRGDLAASSWFRNPMSGSTIPDVYLFACHQGEKGNAQSWAKVFGSRNFHSYNGAGNPYAMYYSHINHVKKITCAKTWKWICVQVADTSKPVPSGPIRRVGYRAETHMGIREAVTKC